LGHVRHPRGGATSLPDYAFRDWLLDRDIPVPEGNTNTDWRLWWQKVKGEDRPLTRAQFLHLLDALNKLPLYQYEVVAVPRDDPAPLPAVGYAVIDRWWTFDDSTFCGNNNPVTVHRTREAAEAERTRRVAADAEQNRSQDPDWQHRYNDGINEYVIVELPLAPEA
jgi:hypothetical protein